MTTLKLTAPVLLRTYDHTGAVLVEESRKFHSQDRFKRSEAQRNALTKLYCPGAVQATSHDNGVVYTFVFRGGVCVVPTLRSLERGW